MKTFHISTLAVSVTMIGAALGAALFAPPISATAAPSATFGVPGASLVSARLSPVSIIGKLAPLTNNKARTNNGELKVVVIEGLDYDLDAVLAGAVAVPRVQLASLPADLHRIRVVDQKKALFFKAVLPLVLQINEEISTDRQRLWDIRTHQKLGAKVPAADRLWLAVMAERYKAKRGDIDALLYRHDVVPPSLALAQAATESAWGTSRFVREGNAMFGEWTYNNNAGLVPLQRDPGMTHKVRAFGSLIDSVRSYVTNLNKHRGYSEFRKLRSEMRAKGGPIDGYQLAQTLFRYSERGAVYVSELQSIIDSNSLRGFDNAKLIDVEPRI